MMSLVEDLSEYEEDLGQLNEAIAYEKSRLEKFLYEQEETSLKIIQCEEALWGLCLQRDEVEKKINKDKGELHGH